RPHRDLGEQSHAEAAVFLRHVVAREPELLRLRLQMRLHLGLELVPVAAGALDRDHLAVDEFPHRVLEHPDLVRQVEVEAVGLGRCVVHATSPDWARGMMRTSTAQAPWSRARTINGFTSMSEIQGRYAVNRRDSPIIACVSAAVSRVSRPRKVPSSSAPRKEKIMSAAVAWSTGSRRIDTSLIASTATPPQPTPMIGPTCGSCRTPISISSPSTISCTRKPSIVAPASCASSRAAMRSAAARTASASARCSATPPTSVLWLACGETIFTATGNP